MAFIKQNPMGWHTQAPAYQGEKWMSCMRPKGIMNNKQTVNVHLFTQTMKKYIGAMT